MSANTKTACPTWCTQTPEGHHTEDGFEYHAMRTEVAPGLRVHLSHFDDGSPEVYVEQDGREMSADEARRVAVEIIVAADLADGGAGRDAAAAAIVEQAMPVARRIWQKIDDEVRQRQAFAQEWMDSESTPWSMLRPGLLADLEVGSPEELALLIGFADVGHLRQALAQEVPPSDALVGAFLRHWLTVPPLYFVEGQR